MGRAALEIWGVSRLGMLVLAWMAAWLFAGGHEAPGPWLARWDRWDAGIFVGVARDGYFGPGHDSTHVAFFPGFPAAMWVVHLVVRNWTAAGLAVSAVAGAVAVVALGKLAADESDGEGNRAGIQGAANATLFFVLAPAGVFLAAGYSECLFAAFAFPAWRAARRDRWVLAAVLAAGASAVRVNGLFLAAAIALEFLLAGTRRRRWRQLPLLLIPVLPLFGYVFYLYRNTGDWLAWQHAQAAGWFRTFKDPKSAWDQTWRAAYGQTQEDHTAWVFQLELVAVVAGAALTLFLLARRRWPEALYVGLSLLALGTTTWFMSVPRAMLLWWPLWTMLGASAVRRPVMRTFYVCCAAPIMVGVALLFLSGQWAG
ncbi:MAG: mannosyltransferase family protein [Catenulispora sp.]